MQQVAVNIYHLPIRQTHLHPFVLIRDHTNQTAASVDTIILLIDDGIHAFQQFDHSLSNTQPRVLKHLESAFLSDAKGSTYSYSGANQRVIFVGDIWLE